MASFTETERNAFPAAKPAKQAFSFAEAPKEKAAPVKEAPKVFRVNVVVEIAIKYAFWLLASRKCTPTHRQTTHRAGAKKENLEGLMKQVQVQGLSFGAVKAAGDKLVWSPTIEQNKVTKEDLLDMTEGFHNYVEVCVTSLIPSLRARTHTLPSRPTEGHVHHVEAFLGVDETECANKKKVNKRPHPSMSDLFYSQRKNDIPYATHLSTPCFLITSTLSFLAPPTTPTCAPTPIFSFTLAMAFLPECPPSLATHTQHTRLALRKGCVSLAGREVSGGKWSKGKREVCRPGGEG